jgi:dTDP-4-dehydrorhamnose reductase
LLLEGRPFLSGAYAPDLARAALDLLVDSETGAWHLSNRGAVSRQEFARLFSALDMKADPAARLVVLASERGILMPSLRDAIERLGAISAAIGVGGVGGAVRSLQRSRDYYWKE